jgi:hypothetical protein
MKHALSILVASFLTLALWLALAMPGASFLGLAWLPSAAWLIFISLASAPRVLSRLFRVDEPTYGPVAFALGAAVPGIGAAIAAVLLLVARYAGEGAVAWACSPIVGALFVLLLLVTIVPIALMGHRSIGAAGANPIADPRPMMRSHPDALRTAADFDSARDNP